MRFAGLRASHDGMLVYVFSEIEGDSCTTHLVTLSDNGQILDDIVLEFPAFFVAHEIELLGDGGLVVAGKSTPSNAGSVFSSIARVSSLTPAREIHSAIPTTFALHPNFPNPFNPSTEISFDMPYGAPATLKVYDILGREVATLADGILEAGTHRVTFDGTGLASGVYIYRLESNNFAQSRKMVLMKYFIRR
ncbi:MAG: T9SS type A sorting domain-containing protein [bacterium]|nr:T9SS type A sorting domain-containing protein [bacterium]